MKKNLSILFVVLLILSWTVTAMATTQYSAGTVYHAFTTSGYEVLYPGLMWRHATCYAYTQGTNSGIYFDGVRQSSNYQRIRAVDENGAYLGPESIVFTNQYARAECYGNMFASKLHLLISKPSSLSSSVKMSTYGSFDATMGT